MLGRPTVAILLWLAASAAIAQAYPTSAIHLVSPYAPGGSTDIVARLVTPKLSSSLGQPVVVDNRAGAGGMIGAEAVARAAPDGYTLMITTSALLSTTVLRGNKAPFDPLKDFTPITAAVTQAGVMLLSTSFGGASSFPALMKFAKSNPGKLSYATTGVGSSFHFMGEVIKLAAGVDMVHVPYKGGAGASQSIASGEVQVALLSNTSGMAAMRSGKARAIATLGDTRAADMPDVPAISEFLPGVERPGDWLGFFGPPGLSPSLLARLHSEFVKALNAPDVVKGLNAGGMHVFGNTPDEFADLMKRNMELYRKLVPLVGIPLE
jgi:tripartite-type tricarboxylate transporter receptor subunit TctC